MANDRIFYALQALGIEAAGDIGFNLNDDGTYGTPKANTISGSGQIAWMKGVQSVGITTNFNLEQIFELGQLAIFENLEGIPEIEVTVEKVIDGNGLLYLTACPSGAVDIIKASKNMANLYLSIYPDTGTSASGTAEASVFCSGMIPTQVSYTFPVEGNATESVTFAGNDKSWTSARRNGYAAFPDLTSNELNKPAPTVTRRQHFIAPTGATYAYAVTTSGTYIPSEIVNAVGYGKVQNINVSAALARENVYELGRYRPYNKFTTYPVAITCEFQVLSTKGDKVNAKGSEKNLSDQAIHLSFQNSNTLTGVLTPGSYLSIDLGQKNKLTSVNYTGGDAGGGNATMTFSYQGFNYFKVTGGGTVTLSASG
jgi:hypothetical protein